MKKILTVAFAMAMCLSFGASIKWQLATTALKSFTVDTTTGAITEGTANLAGASLYFFLGEVTSDAANAAFTDAGFNSSLITGATLLDTATSLAGGNKPTGTTVLSNEGISSAAENIFTLVASYKSGDDYFYKVVTGSQFGYETVGDPLPPTKTMTFTAAAVQGSKWTAVPEPASAMLALAGVAMLIRRRK
jgi:hypothetical protein